MVNLAPVDYVSTAIVHLSNQQESLGQIFHLINPQPVPWDDVVNWIQSFNYPLRKIPYDKWRVELIQYSKSQENAFAPLMSFFMTESNPSEMGPQHFSCENTLAGLEGTSIKCPPVDAALLHTYFSYFIRGGFLKPPKMRA